MVEGEICRILVDMGTKRFGRRGDLWLMSLTNSVCQCCAVQDEEEPNLLMGEEEYDDPKDLVATLPERCMLCDFVETLPRIGKDVAKVRN